jgi:hypothetical protein
MIGEEACEGSHLAPEVRLFRQVILHAVLDAIYGSWQNHPENDRIKAEAWRWFARADQDFQLVCECADMHPAAVRKDALAYISNARQTLPADAKRPRSKPTGTVKRRRIAMRQAA